MNSASVIEMAPKAEQAKARLIMGLIPCQNQYVLNLISPVILPGLKELAEMSLEEFTVGQVMNDILFGGKQLHMAYIDRTGEVKVELQQAQFATMLQEPAKDFVGFIVIEPLRSAGFHIYAAYSLPEYRNTNMLQLGLAYLEGEARKMGSPYISLATRPDVINGIEHFGYKATTTNFRKKLG
jgi:hypothetical protein